MATLTKGKTFTSGETVTPAKLHELVDQGTVTGIVNADIASNAAIAASKLGSGALPAGVTVASANLVDGTIVNADINASAAIAGSKLAAGGVGTTQLTDAAVTAAKLDGAQTGSAPIYGCRGWVEFDGTRNASGGSDTANTDRFIVGQGNVSRVTKTGTGAYDVIFTVPLNSSSYAAIATGGQRDDSTGAESTTTTSRTGSGFKVYTAAASAGSLTNRSDVSVAVFG